MPCQNGDEMNASLLEQGSGKILQNMLNQKRHPNDSSMKCKNMNDSLMKNNELAKNYGEHE